MKRITSMPPAVLLGLVAAVILDTIIQIKWKTAVSCAPNHASLISSALSAFRNPYFYVAMGAFLAQLFNWLRVLARADLSYAQPFTALSNITVLAFSSYTLHEKISPTRMFGVALILLGVVFISQTPVRTDEKALG